MGSTTTISILVLLLLGLVQLTVSGHDYKQALSKSILFFEAQRSGHLPPNQRVSWRSHSGLYDGKSSGVDLVGGYYDAGDNVKFGLPMAFTVTTICWSIIEYGGQLESNGELGHAIDAVKWGTDYFIKAHPEPNVLYGEVGDGKSDHYCWQRPEEMTTDRKAYKIDRNNSGSDLAGETAAAMAAASIVFRRSDRAYSAELLRHARQLFEFADKYRGKYDSSITVAQKYYRSVSGYNDELLWAAAWLYQATNDKYYLDYLGKNGDSMGGTGWSMTEFGWDVKYAGVQTLVAKVLMQGKGGEHTAVFERYQQKAEQFMCSLLGKSTKNIKKTPGGLIFRQSWNNMQFVTSASFLAAVYSDYLSSSKRDLRCSQGNISPSQLLDFSKSQVNYILGDNPRATSYMVGYGENYPRQVHHRGSSIVSFNVDQKFVTCRGGYATWFSRKGSDPNVLTGAIVGGPDAYDNFADQRDNYEQTEPATYNNAPLLGVLARLISGSTGFDQLLPGVSPTPSPVINKPAPVPKKKPTTPPVSSPIPITISQKMTLSWKNEGKVYYRYSTRLTNISTKTLKKLKISITKLYGPIWGVTKTGTSFSFPSWMQSLPAGKSMEFVYIHSAASPADVLVSNYSLE
ncbi:Carbohydrate binding domain CBM49 [Arabidopsis suecica]|uniref:cellulase n=1 Tax=Arabidopsis suecica TaxID=45249 RepID=A0A8T1ZGU3_ARASU|nr:Carbohydrate binding domain CBM49 [Arabidopsis suecica]